MNRNRSLWLIALAVALSGCASMEKSVLLGSGIGFGVGAGIGAIATDGRGGSSTAGTLIGAAVGGILGGMIGADGYKKKEAKDKTKLTESLPPQVEFLGNASTGTNTPKLRPAQVRVHYVEDQIKEGTFIPAHFEYEIAEPARWEGSR